MAVQGINVTKANAYAVTSGQPGVNVAKANAYAVTSGQPGINVAKANAYAVVIAGLLVIPGTAHLALTRYSPTVKISTPIVTVPVGKASLTITGHAPSLKFTRKASPGTAALSITPFAPTVHATANYTAQVQPASPRISTYTPLAYVWSPAIPPVNAIYSPGAAPGAGDIYRLDQQPGGSDIYRLDQDPGGSDIYRSGQTGIYKSKGGTTRH